MLLPFFYLGLFFVICGGLFLLGFLGSYVAFPWVAETQGREDRFLLVGKWGRIGRGVCLTGILHGYWILGLYLENVGQPLSRGELVGQWSLDAARTTKGFAASMDPAALARPAIDFRADGTCRFASLELDSDPEREVRQLGLLEVGRWELEGRVIRIRLTEPAGEFRGRRLRVVDDGQPVLVQVVGDPDAGMFLVYRRTRIPFNDLSLGWVFDGAKISAWLMLWTVVIGCCFPRRGGFVGR